MKTKILFFSLLSLLIFSCSGDDDSGSDPEAQIPAEEKLLESVKIGVNEMMRFNYNPDKTVNELTITDYALLRFTYEQGNIHSITVVAGGASQEYLFTYQNGKISSFSEDDEVTQVTYNAAGNYYLYQNEYQEEYTIELDANGEIEKRVIYDNAQDEIISSYFYIYDLTKMGTMTNSNSISIHVSMIIDAAWEFLGIPISKYPLKTLSTTQGNIEVENTFDNQEFVKSAVLGLGQEEPLSFSYTYTQL